MDVYESQNWNWTIEVSELNRVKKSWKVPLGLGALQSEINKHFVTFVVKNSLKKTC